MGLYTVKAKIDASTVSVQSLLKCKVVTGTTNGASSTEKVGNLMGEGYTVLLFVRNGAVQLAAWSKAADVLRRNGVNLLVVSTSSMSYSEKFKANIGFDVPGRIVTDTSKATHKACSLKSSIWASLVMPFKKHLKTFGKGAIFEGLRVSLMNATRGHGSSFQQGGTFVFKKGGNEVDCTLAWREQYPGDWMQIRDVLMQGCDFSEGEESLEVISWSEVLEFVVKARKGEVLAGELKGGVEGGDSENGVSPPAAPCGDNACDLKEMRKMMKATAKAKVEAEKEMD